MFDIKKAFDTIIGYTIGSKNELKKKKLRERKRENKNKTIAALIIVKTQQKNNKIKE